MLALEPLDGILPADRPYHLLARFYAGLGDVEKARELLAAGELNDRAIGRNQWAETAWTRGAIALAERDPGGAERSLREAAELHWCAICPLPDLGRAFDSGGKHDLALETYEAYVGTPWLWRYENDAVELGTALRRLKQLYEARGDTAGATRVSRALEQVADR